MLGSRRTADKGVMTAALAVAVVGTLALLHAGVGAAPGRRTGVHASRLMHGARHGAPAPAAHLVALGDSVATGFACGCDGYPTVLAGQLAEQHGLAADVVDDAVNGLTTAGLLRQLQDPDVRNDVSRATVVTVTIGANDFDESSAGRGSCVSPQLACYQQALAGLPDRMSAALTAVRAAAPTAQVVLTDYWNVFQDGQVAAQQGPAAVAAGRDLTARVNEVLEQTARAAGVVYVDLDAPFHSADPTPLLTSDGDHPSAAGASVIARAVAQALA